MPRAAAMATPLPAGSSDLTSGASRGPSRAPGRRQDGGGRRRGEEAGGQVRAGARDGAALRGGGLADGADGAADRHGRGVRHRADPQQEVHLRRRRQGGRLHLARLHRAAQRAHRGGLRVQGHPHAALPQHAHGPGADAAAGGARGRAGAPRHGGGPHGRGQVHRVPPAAQLRRAPGAPAHLRGAGRGPGLRLHPRHHGRPLHRAAGGRGGRVFPPGPAGLPLRLHHAWHQHQALQQDHVPAGRRLQPAVRGEPPRLGERLRHQHVRLGEGLGLPGAGARRFRLRGGRGGGAGPGAALQRAQEGPAPLCAHRAAPQIWRGGGALQGLPPRVQGRPHPGVLLRLPGLLLPARFRRQVLRREDLQGGGPHHPGLVPALGDVAGGQPAEAGAGDAGQGHGAPPAERQHGRQRRRQHLRDQRGRLHRGHRRRPGAPGLHRALARASPPAQELPPHHGHSLHGPQVAPAGCCGSVRGAVPCVPQGAPGGWASPGGRCGGCAPRGERCPPPAFILFVAFVIKSLPFALRLLLPSAPGGGEGTPGCSG